MDAQLDKVESTMVRVRLTAFCTTDDDIKPLKCNVQQKSSGANTFCIKVKKSSHAKLPKVQAHSRGEQNDTSGRLSKKMQLQQTVEISSNKGKMHEFFSYFY